MPGDPFELTAVLQVSDGRLRVVSHQQELGTWALEDVSASLRPDGCHVMVDGEELIVTVPHPVRLAEAIGIDWTDPARDPLPEVTPEESAEPAEPERQPSFLQSIPLGWKLAAVVGGVAAGLWVFLPTALVGLVVLAGAALLLGGTLAALDPFTSVRLPERLTPARLLGTGVAVIALALVLAVLIA